MSHPICHDLIIDTCLICLAKETMLENPRTVALKDLQTMLERMLQNQEQNFIRALETQRESILGEVRNMMKAPSPAS